MLFWLIIAAYMIVAYGLNFFLLRLDEKKPPHCEDYTLLAMVWLNSFASVYVSVFFFIVDNSPNVLDRLGRFIAGRPR